MKNLRSIITQFALLISPVVSFSQVPDLGTAANFVLFTTTGAVSNTGVSLIVNKIGTNNGAITGFTLTPGQEYANTITAQAAIDLQVAYDAMYISPATFPVHAAILGNGETLIPGIYLIAEAASIEGILILDAQGNGNAVFIIKILGAFSPGPSSQVSLTGGARACNIFWLVQGGAIAIAALGDMKGNFIANPGAVSMAATSRLEGRLLSNTGAIAVDGIIANLPICNTLPVTLVHFTAAKKNGAIDVLWTVENEFSFSAYELERSAEGMQYTAIGTIIPTMATGSKDYHWLDNSPLPLLNFYRLKMFDINGTFNYSPILRISMNKNKGITIYPNPSANHLLILQMYGQVRGMYLLDLYNSNGIRVMSSKIFHDENDATRTIAVDNNLATGYYFLKITAPTKKTETVKLLMQ